MNEISALIAMIDYFIPKVREVSPMGVLHSNLAKEKIQVEEVVRDNKVAGFRLCVGPPRHSGGLFAVKKPRQAFRANT